MPHRTLAATTFALFLASAAPPPALAAESPLSRPISTIRSAPGEIWSALRSFISFLGHGMDPNGLQLPDSGHEMDPNGSESSDSDLGHEMDPNG
jgi:hypothetical protein